MNRQERLRTSPLYAPEVVVAPGSWRAAPGGSRLSILAHLEPTRFAWTWAAAASQKLEVRKDPNSGGTDAEIQDQIRMLFELQREMDSVADLVNEIEVVRSQITHSDQPARKRRSKRPARRWTASSSISSRR
jgi:hypothetical protein